MDKEKLQRAQDLNDRIDELAGVIRMLNENCELANTKCGCLDSFVKIIQRAYSSKIIGDAECLAMNRILLSVVVCEHEQAKAEFQAL